MSEQISTQIKPETQTQVDENFKKIGIFPGTFNPIHNGQLIVAEQIINHYDLDAFFFCLLENNEDDQERIQMIQLSINGNSKFHIVNKIYPNNKKIVDDFIEKYPETEILFIAGASKLQVTKDFNFSNNQVKLIGLVESKIKKTKELKIEWFKFPRLDISSELIRENIKHYKTVRYLIPDIVAAYIAEYNLYK